MPVWNSRCRKTQKNADIHSLNQDIRFFFTINFIFSLGLTTDIYHLYLAKSFDALSGVKLSGTGLFKEIQPFNTSFVDACIAMIIVAVFLFVTKTNSRRKLT